MLRDSVPDFKVYPFSIPSIQSLDELELDAKVTFLIGENGAGKSTLIEAIAVLMGFNAERGSKNFRFDMFFRLKERGVDPAILKEHAAGVREAYSEYWDKTMRQGRARSNAEFVKREEFPDLAKLEARFTSEEGSL